MVRAFCALLLLAGCQPDFRPESLIENLRFLGVRAQPADLLPGETATLSPLVLDPSRVGEAPGLVWLACEPDPFNLNRTACSDPMALSDPSTIFAGGQLPIGIRLAGFGPQLQYTAPATLFDVLPSDDPTRLTGTVVPFLILAVAEPISPAMTQDELRALFERVQRKETKSIITIYRLRISQNTQRNSNPSPTQLLVGGERWPWGARIALLPQEPVVLDIEVEPLVRERFDELTPSGIIEKQENLLFSWYSTAGRFNTSSTALDAPVKAIFTAPGSDKDPIPARRSGALYVAARDSRGGFDYRQAGFFVCDASLADPIVRAARVEGANLVLEGTDVDQLLDVIVGGKVIVGGARGSNRWEGPWPTEAPVGPARVRLHGRNCNRRDGPMIQTP
jgi:hypothetical protein